MSALGGLCPCDTVEFVNDVYVSYGDERPAYEQFPRTWQVKPYDGSGNRSYVTFVFRYRSRGKSQARW